MVVDKTGESVDNDTAGIIVYFSVIIKSIKDFINDSSRVVNDASRIVIEVAKGRGAHFYTDKAIAIDRTGIVKRRTTYHNWSMIIYCSPVIVDDSHRNVDRALKNKQYYTIRNGNRLSGINC